jgi:hypothetical protein
VAWGMGPRSCTNLDHKQQQRVKSLISQRFMHADAREQGVQSMALGQGEANREVDVEKGGGMLGVERPVGVVGRRPLRGLPLLPLDTPL